MIKEELVNYFSYYQKRGKSIEELQKEALEKGYSKRDVIDSLSSLGIDTTLIKKKSSTGKVVLLTIFILIVIGAIITIIILNLKTEPKEETPLIEEKNFEELTISTQLFNQSNSGTPEALESYLLSNPIEKQNSKELSENFKNCINTDAQFSGTIPELEGSLHIENFGDNNCFVSYRSDLTMDCNYTKDQVRITYEAMEEKDMGDVAGPFFYFGSYFEIQMRMLGEIIKQKVNETYEKTGKMGNLTLGEDLMTEEIEREFNNPETGKKEIVKCLVY